MSKKDEKKMVTRPFNGTMVRKHFQSPFNSLFNELFSQFMTDFLPTKSDSFNYEFGSYPKCDIKEYEDSFQIEMQIPGLTKDDIKIEYNENEELLVISGEKRTLAGEEDGAVYLKRQLKKSKFLRSFYISKQEIEGEFQAKFNDGILEIDIRKKESKEEKENSIKKIQIK